MQASQSQTPERRGVGAQLISDQQFRHKALLLEQLAHQPQRRPGVAPAVPDRRGEALCCRKGVDIIAGASLALRTVNPALSGVKIRLRLPRRRTRDAANYGNLDVSTWIPER